MNQKLLRHTLKNRCIEPTNQEEEDYHPRGLLFMPLLTSVALLFYLLMVKVKGETIEPESVWSVVLSPVIFAVVGCITYRSKKNTLKLHYTNTVFTPQEQQKILIRLAKENRWKTILCNKQQLITDDIYMRWRMRITAIFGNPHMAYNGRYDPTRRWHASGGRNHDNRETICQVIEREWTTKNEN